MDELPGGFIVKEENIFGVAGDVNFGVARGCQTLVYECPRAAWVGQSSHKMKWASHDLWWMCDILGFLNYPSWYNQDERGHTQVALIETSKLELDQMRWAWLSGRSWIGDESTRLLALTQIWGFPYDGMSWPSRANRAHTSQHWRFNYVLGCIHKRWGQSTFVELTNEIWRVFQQKRHISWVRHVPSHTPCNKYILESRGIELEEMTWQDRNPSS